MTRLRRKLETNPAEPEFLLTVRGEGYRLVSDLK
jgi:two-component system phosphate regulon response regulator OmpR